MLLCLVRHGQSEGNNQQKLSGLTDHALTELGVNQAEKCGKLLSEVKFDALYSSNLTRAIATAQLIKNQNIIGINEWHRSSDINERGYGVVENKTRDDIIKLYSNNVIDNWFNRVNATPPGGESYLVVYKRCYRFYKKHVIPNLDQKNLLIVAHAGVIKCLMAIIEDKKLSDCIKMPIKNAVPIMYEF